jgi:UDP-2-acetamido-3-amino-2,3-dideoxy-glucuronate N-acetyltransferase
MSEEGKYLNREAWRDRRKPKTIKKEKSSSFFVHESSFVDNNVEIGDGTKIWHFSHILSGTTIGKNCSFGQNCVVGGSVRVGSGVKVQNNVSIYEGVEIEDDVFLGASMVFTNVINPRAFIQRKDEFKKTLLKKGCSIGANATIVCGVTIGEYALIGSGAVVNRAVKPYALMGGVPARQIGWVGISGNTLNFVDNIATDEFATYELVDSELKVTNIQDKKGEII